MTLIVSGADYGAHVGKLAHRSGSPRGVNYLTYPFDRQRSVVLFDDFVGDTINLDNWALTKDLNGTDYAINAAAGGTIRGTAGNTDGEGIGINGAAIWLGDKNCGMEVRMKLNVVTNSSMEIGFADTATSFKDPIVTDVDVVTAANGANDFAIVKRDTAQTLTTGALVTLGSTPYTVTKSNLATWAPTLATYFIARVQLIGDNVFAAIFDDSGALVTSTSITAVAAGAGGIEGGVLLSPYVNVTRVSTADKIADIDYICVWQDR